MTRLIKYTGSKWRIAEWIISHFPEHDTYIEPFFGSGGVFFRKQPSKTELINDINDEVINIFKIVRDKPQELAWKLETTPYAHSEFDNCKNEECDEVERARRSIVRFNQSARVGNNKKNTWAVEYKYNACEYVSSWNKLPLTVIEMCKRLKETQIENMDALTLIQKCNNPNTLIYLDPPYLKGTWKSFSHKYNDNLSDNRHIALCDIIKGSKSKIILSGYDNEIYNSLLSDWNTDVVQTQDTVSKMRTEKIWFNYDLGLF